MKLFGSVLLLALAPLVLATSCGRAPRAPEPGPPQSYKVYVLAGQSNMEGYGWSRHLDQELHAPVDGVFIFNGRMRADDRTNAGIGLWQMLQPGFGRAFDTNGQRNDLSGRFGPELSFGRRMKALQPDQPIAIIKYARGGTALAHGVGPYGSWDPDYDEGQNQFDHALAAIENAFAARDVNGDGVEDMLVPAGIVWMQGESDAAYDRDAAFGYQDNLSRLMALLRQAVGEDDLPVVIGRIADSGDTPETRVMRFSSEVRAQQKSFVEADSCAALVTVTDEFSFLPDGWHYVSEDYLTLGEAFADEMVALEERC